MSSHREIANCNPEQHQEPNISNRSIKNQVTSSSQDSLTNNADYNGKRRSTIAKEITSHKLNVFYITFNLSPEWSVLALILKRALLLSRSVEAQDSIFQRLLVVCLRDLISNFSSYISMLIYRWSQSLWFQYYQINLRVGQHKFFGCWILGPKVNTIMHLTSHTHKLSPKQV